MNPAGRNGIIAGALVGCLAAAVNWEGEVGVAASSIIVGAAIGWTIGYHLYGKRKS